MLVGLLAGVALPATSHAQPEPTADGYAEQGYKKYEAGEFSDAIALYMNAFKLSQDARILFNVAQIYDRKIQDRDLAIEFYRRYLKSTTAEGDLVKKATDRIRALQEQSSPRPNTSPSTSAAVPVAPPAASAGPVNESRALRTAAYVTGGLGVVGLAIGSAFGLSASSKHSDAKDAGCSGKTCPTEDSASTERKASRAATVSTIGFISGGALLATGITLFFLSPSREETKSASIRITPQISPGSLGLSVSGLLF